MIICFTILFIGCFENETKDILDQEDEVVERSENGSDYLLEGDSLEVFRISINETEFLSELRAQVHWEDEPPSDGFVQYVNEGDIFLVKITDSSGHSVMDSTENNPGSDGLITVQFPCDLADSQIDAVCLDYIIEIELVDAGEQHPWYTGEDRRSIEDDGNEFDWSVDLKYVQRS